MYRTLFHQFSRYTNVKNHFYIIQFLLLTLKFSFSSHLINEIKTQKTHYGGKKTTIGEAECEMFTLDEG